MAQRPQQPLDKLILYFLLIASSTTVIFACTQTHRAPAKSGPHSHASRAHGIQLPEKAPPTHLDYQDAFAIHRSFPMVPPTFSAHLQAAIHWGNENFTWYKGGAQMDMREGQDERPCVKGLFDTYCNAPRAPACSCCTLTDVDAALYQDATTAYFFSGTDYHVLDLRQGTFSPTQARNIASQAADNPWKNLPPEFQCDLDASVNDGLGNVYFFKGGKYLRYDRYLGKVLEQPTAISARWPMLPREFHAGIDAAMRSGRGTVTLFKAGMHLQVRTSEVI